jgi:hypothetical protein
MTSTCMWRGFFSKHSASQTLDSWLQLYMLHPPLQCADVRQWNLHLLEGFITSGPFYLYCFFNCLLSSPYSSLVNTYIYNIHPCSFTLLFFKLDTHTHTHTHSCCLKKYFHLLFFNICDTLCSA